MKFNKGGTIFVFLLTGVLFVGCQSFKKEFLQEHYRPYYDVAFKAYRAQQYDMAAENYAKACAVLEANGDFVGYVYREYSYVQRAQGKYDVAVNERNTVDRLQSRLNEAKEWNRKELQEEIYFCYGDLGEIYQEWGKYGEAWTEFSKSMEQGTSYNKYKNYYPPIGLYYVEIGQYETAVKYLTDSLNAIKKEAYWFEIAQVKNKLAMAYYYAGEDAKAEEVLRGAARLNENAFGGFPEDMAKSYTMLGRLAEHKGENDKAFEYYNKAFDVLPRFKDFVHKTEQADVMNQIGRFQLRQGKPKESEKSYKEAVGLRRETGTATHPNYADALKGLADVAAYQNELTSASLLATQALAVLDNSVVATHPRTAPVLIALSSIRAMSGESVSTTESALTSATLSSASLNSRLDTIMQKPLGPWKEDFLDTATFYAQLLKESGKQADAARLEQFVAGQKDKN